jgi:TonB family protein
MKKTFRGFRGFATVMLAWTLMAPASARAADSPLDVADSSLDAAITLYMSASYEEALSELSQLPPSADLDQADKYRALCLLGLNRPQEAAESIDRLVKRRPLLKVDEKDSPKLVLMYHDAQTRLLPGAAKALYATAKEHFEHGEIAASAEEFRQVLGVIAEVGGTGAAGLTDLKMLAEGFSSLADRQLAATRAAATPSPAAAAEGVQAGRSAAASPDVRAPRIFDATDRDVTPPVAIAQTMPIWSPRADVEKRSYSGTMEVVVDENGAVSSAAIMDSVYPSYDQQLLQAARSWRYKPAMRAGQPVKYRRGVTVVLTPPRG